MSFPLSPGVPGSIDQKIPTRRHLEPNLSQAIRPPETRQRHRAEIAIVPQSHASVELPGVVRAIDPLFHPGSRPMVGNADHRHRRFDQPAENLVPGLRSRQQAIGGLHHPNPPDAGFRSVRRMKRSNPQSRRRESVGSRRARIRSFPFEGRWKFRLPFQFKKHAATSPKNGNADNPRRSP